MLALQLLAAFAIMIGFEVYYRLSTHQGHSFFALTFLVAMRNNTR